MYEYVKLGRKFMTFCTFFMYSGGISYHTVMPFFLNVSPMIGNKTRRPHIYFGYDSVFDSQATPTYEIVFFVHLVGSIITYTLAVAACSLAALFASHICGQVDILNTLLYDLVSDTNQSSKKLLDRQIAVIIKSHVRILRFAEMIEQMLREICLVEVLASTLIICLLEYYFLMEWTNSETIVLVTYIVLIISLSCNMFIFCYIGEILQEQCASIGQSTYMIKWYQLNGKAGLSLMLVIAMANYPLKITAGGLMDLNIRSFGSIIKTSVVYLNMLRTVTD
ncbi:odorant receptor 67c-like [Chelonus insularis]|uniref:odorant receptor 67c-like n=1 Tax=Chelonus insularis TaxID=460826 RepID=UPI00158C0CD9|nr:odorant receptor 67c-like [Chelonus insularis]